MTDTTIQPINPDASNEATIRGEISALAALVETIAQGQKAITDGLNRFSTAVVETLSGQHAVTSAAPAATAAKRRGRPPKAASEAPAAPAKPRELTADEHYAVELVRRAGRMTQAELADVLKIERSLVQARMKEPMRRRLVITEIVEPVNGGHRHIVYHRADWVNFKGR